VIGLSLTLSAPASAQNAQNVVTKAAWIDAMKTALPVAFCQDNTYFRSCFTISQEECESTATSATRVCLSKVENAIPAMIHQPAEGSSWGEKVGSCAGNAFDATRAGQKLDTPKCNDPSAWM
jgi:hypothetical protein